MSPGQKLVFGWIFKIMLASLPALVSGMFSYFSAKADTEISYTTLVQAVKELQEEVKAQDQLLHTLKGETEIIRQIILLPRKEPSQGSVGALNNKVTEAITIVSKPERLFQPKALPETFSDMRRLSRQKPFESLPKKVIPAEALISP